MRSGTEAALGRNLINTDLRSSRVKGLNKELHKLESYEFTKARNSNRTDNGARMSRQLSASWKFIGEFGDVSLLNLFMDGIPYELNGSTGV